MRGGCCDIRLSDSVGLVAGRGAHQCRRSVHRRIRGRCRPGRLHAGVAVWPRPRLDTIYPVPDRRRDTRCGAASRSACRGVFVDSPDVPVLQRLSHASRGGDAWGPSPDAVPAGDRRHATEPPVPRPYSWVLDEWTVFLRQHQGLAAASVQMYRGKVKPFLADLDADAAPDRFATLTPERIG